MVVVEGKGHRMDWSSFAGVKQKIEKLHIYLIVPVVP